MRKEISQMLEGYGNVCRYDDAASAYVDFHQTVNETNPDPDEISSMLVHDTHALAVLTSGVMRLHGLRGSGMVLLGNNEGRILSTHYSAQEIDPVAERYGSYQKVAIRKIGQGALVGRSRYKDPYDQYQYIEEILVDNGLKPSYPTHHLDYVALNTGNDLFITAGASGMLPSTEVADYMRERESERLQRDYEAGLLDWAGDEFAGLYDLLAASVVASKYSYMAGYYKAEQLNLNVFDLLSERSGQNLH